MGARKSQVIEEEEESGDSECDDDDIEEVDAFSPTDEKSPAFREAESLIEGGDASAAHRASTDDTTSSTANTEGMGLQDGAGNPEEHKKASLLPALEIEGLEPRLTPFHPTNAIEADSEIIHPPRSSSLRERNLGTPKSARTLDTAKLDVDKPLPTPKAEDSDAGDVTTDGDQLTKVETA
jgi:hypothetical protein